MQNSATSWTASGSILISWKAVAKVQVAATFAVPQMIIKLRQGAGRLIRTESDTGILAILDARAAKGGAYRHRVLTALSKYPLVRTVFDVRAFIDEVKDESYKKGA